MNEDDEIERVATTIMVIALAISLGACLIGILQVILPYFLAAVEAWRFAP